MWPELKSRCKLLWPMEDDLARVCGSSRDDCGSGTLCEASYARGEGVRVNFFGRCESPWKARDLVRILG